MCNPPVGVGDGPVGWGELLTILRSVHKSFAPTPMLTPGVVPEGNGHGYGVRALILHSDAGSSCGAIVVGLVVQQAAGVTSELSGCTSSVTGMDGRPRHGLSVSSGRGCSHAAGSATGKGDQGQQGDHQQHSARGGLLHEQKSNACSLLNAEKLE